MPQHRALEWLHTYGRRYPRAWDFYAEVQEERQRFQKKSILDASRADSGFNWPDWCWAPITVAHAIISRANATDLDERDFVATVPYSGALAAVAAWRPTQGIYRFDRTLFDEIWDTPVTGKMPWEVLRRLPEWCCYVEVPDGIYHIALVDELVSSGQGERELPLRGFFVHLEWDDLEKQEALRFSLDVEGIDNLIPAMIYRAETMEEGLERSFEVYRKSIQLRHYGVVHIKEYEALNTLDDWLRENKLLQHLTSVAVYLCCDENDVPSVSPKPPRVLTTKKGRTIVPTPTRPQVYECGVRIGAALRWANEQREKSAEAGEPTGRTVIPHVRKAHYHHFWRGPRDGERVLFAKFLPSIQVNFKGVPETPTLRPVK